MCTSAILLLSLCFVFVSCSSVKSAGEGNLSFSNDPQASLTTVRLAPDVTEDMLLPSYWISRCKNPYEIKMTPEEIGFWNRSLLNKSFDGKGQNTYLITDLRSWDRFCTGKEIRDDLMKGNPKSPWYVKNKGEIHQLSEEDWLVYYRLMNYDRLGSEAYFLRKEGASDKVIEDADYPLRRGLCLYRTDLRLLPSRDFFSNEKDLWYDDMAQNSGIQINEPLIVRWESSDKKWLFVSTCYCSGWIEREAVAFLTDEEFDRYFDYEKKDPGSFVTVTADRFTLREENYVKAPGDGQNPPALARDFYMGNYLHTASWDDERFSQVFLPRIPYSCYLVEIPYKKADESLGISYGAIPGGNCCRGLMDFTGANVLTLAFSVLGDRYGWGGMEKARDCSEYLKDIFHCFGFIFPRNSRGQLAIPGRTFDFEGKSLSARKKLVSSSSPGDIFGFPGHVFMYLGEEGGKQYVLSALGSYCFEKPRGSSEEIKEFIINANSVSLNTLDVYRKNGMTWLENMTSAKGFSIKGQKDWWHYEREISLDPKWNFAENSLIHSGKAILYRAGENRKNKTVAVNAGHGCKGGSSQRTWSHPDRSPKLTGGTDAAGVTRSTAISGGMVFKDGRAEAEVNLRQAHLLRNILLEAGYDVLMIRDRYDVQLDNIARTVISNNCADIHLAIHYDGDRYEQDKGCFYCSIPEGLKALKNVKKHAPESTRLGECLIQGLREQDLLIYEEGRMEVDLTQTSYSTIPSVDIELGNQWTNTSTENLQIRAEGMLKGIELFFEGKR